MELEREKCLQCSYVPCINLLRQDGDLLGGELFLIKEVLDNALFLPCIPGQLLYACCRLWQGAYETLEEGELSPFLLLFEQCLFDLRTSLFLAFTCHFRGAMQILRPVLENAIVGLWFSLKLKIAQGEEIETVKKDFLGWIEGRFKVPRFKDMVKTLEKDNFLIRETKEPWKKVLIEYSRFHPFYPPVEAKRITDLWDNLNKFLHPEFPETDIGRLFGKEINQCPLCIALVRWDKKGYDEWLKYYQDVIDILIRFILGIFPQAIETESGQEGLSWLKNLEEEEKLGIPVITCPHLKRLLETIEEED